MITLYNIRKRFDSHSVLLYVISVNYIANDVSIVIYTFLDLCMSLLYLPSCFRTRVTITKMQFLTKVHIYVYIHTYTYIYFLPRCRCIYISTKHREITVNCDKHSDSSNVQTIDAFRQSIISTLFQSLPNLSRLGTKIYFRDKFAGFVRRVIGRNV